jgi:hypothetical protein
MVSKKDRRSSGRVCGQSTIKAKREEIIQNCLEPQEFWNDWGDHRDGLRRWKEDFSKIKNKKVLRKSWKMFVT